MNRWNLLLVGLFTVVGCHKSANDAVIDDTSGAGPVDQTNLTGATVNGPITPPPSVDTTATPETANPEPADDEHGPGRVESSPVMSPAVPERTTPARPSRRTSPDTEAAPASSSFPETTFGPTTAEGAGGSFPESSFRDDDNRASQGPNRRARSAVDAGPSFDSEDVPR